MDKWCPRIFLQITEGFKSIPFDIFIGRMLCCQYRVTANLIETSERHLLIFVFPCSSEKRKFWNLLMVMSSNMRKTMAGGIVTPQNSFKNSHQIHFSSADKQLLAFVYKSLPDQRGISYKYWSDYAALRVS